MRKRSEDAEAPQDHPSTSGATTHTQHEMSIPDPPNTVYRAHPPRTLLLLESQPLGFLLSQDAPYQARTYPSWEALTEAARREAPSTAVLVNPFADDTLTPDPSLRELLRVAPLLPVLAWIDLGSSCVEGIRSVLEWGVSGLVDHPLEAPPEALVSRLRDAHARPFKHRLDRLSRYTSGNAVTLIRAAAEVSSDGGLSTDLASIFGVTERTLSEWCTREALPPPRRLLAWTRVLLAIALLEEPGRTWRNVAQSTGYVNDRGLRRAIKSLLREDQAPADLRQHTFAEAVKTFEGELFEHRERLRLVRRPRVTPARPEGAVQAAAFPAPPPWFPGVATAAAPTRGTAARAAMHRPGRRRLPAGFHPSRDARRLRGWNRREGMLCR